MLIVIQAKEALIFHGRMTECEVFQTLLFLFVFHIFHVRYTDGHFSQ